MILTVLSECSEEDRAILQQMYGKKDAVCVASVKQLFSRYNVAKQFCAYEEATKQRVRELIANDRFPKRIVPVVELLIHKLFSKMCTVCWSITCKYVLLSGNCQMVHLTATNIRQRENTILRSTISVRFIQ